MKTANDHLKGKFDRFNVEFQFAHKNGTWIWIQGKGKVVAHDKDGNPTRFVGTHSDITGKVVAHDKDGNPTRFVGTHSDITERKQAEIRLSQKSTLLDNILRGSTEYAIVTTDCRTSIWLHSKRGHWKNSPRNAHQRAGGSRAIRKSCQKRPRPRRAPLHVYPRT
ncbi:MAG: hypothetical protein B5M51_06010 [Anaerolinea sp. 4484_236]|nr:MAG: hypothetical protein B5M51_06010 [Anaerolinea sp. 4484_236]